MDVLEAFDDVRPAVGVGEFKSFRLLGCFFLAGHVLEILDSARGE